MFWISRFSQKALNSDLLKKRNSMIFNANDLTFPLPKFDYCVIGSGAGGATVALELLKSGKSVILLEAGNLVGNSEILHPVNVGAPFGLRSTRSISM